MFVDGDAAHHLLDHVQAVFQLVKRGEEYLLDDLQVAEVARRQVVGDKGDLVRQRLYLVAFGPCELKYVGGFLMGHDARPRGVGVG